MAQSTGFIPPAVAIVKKGCLAIAETSDHLTHLIGITATEITQEMHDAEDTPLITLRRRQSSKDIQTEVINKYINTVSSLRQKDFEALYSN